jgi:hypothetical protein
MSKSKVTSLEFTNEQHPSQLSYKSYHKEQKAKSNVIINAKKDTKKINFFSFHFRFFFFGSFCNFCCVAYAILHVYYNTRKVYRLYRLINSRTYTI